MIKSNSLWFIPTEHNKKESTFFCVKCCRTVYEWVKRTWLYNTCNKKIFVKLPLFLFFGEENKSQIPRKKLNSILSVAVFFFLSVVVVNEQVCVVLVWSSSLQVFWMKHLIYSLVITDKCSSNFLIYWQVNENNHWKVYYWLLW